MADKTRAIPEGFRTLTPHLTVRDATRAIDFYQKAFGAEVLQVNHTPDGKIMHAALKIGDSMLMLNDEFPEPGGTLSPLASGGTGVMLHLYLENVDTVFARAISAGATVKMAVTDMFWGDRYGQLMDPFGHKWSLATHTRDLSPDEMRMEHDKALSKVP
jgi:PhnB protein